MAEVTMVKEDQRVRQGVKTTCHQRHLTDCLLRADSEGAKECLASLRASVDGHSNYLWRVRRACKAALVHVADDLRAGRKDARQTANLVRALMAPRMFDDLVVRLGLQHVTLS